MPRGRGLGGAVGVRGRRLGARRPLRRGLVLVRVEGRTVVAAGLLPVAAVALVRGRRRRRRRLGLRSGRQRAGAGAGAGAGLVLVVGARALAARGRVVTEERLTRER